MLQTYTRPLLNLLRGRPLLAIFEVTLRCNSFCRYCDLPLNKGRYELTREQIQGIFSSLFDNGLRHIFIQGGEPFVRKDLFEILQDLLDIGYGLTVITNGTRLNEDNVKRLHDLPVSLSISLDSLDRERYKKIRGADQLPLVLRGIDNLADFPHPKYLTCIVSEENREDVLDVVRFARKKGFIPVVGAYHWDIERYGKIDAELQYEQQAAIEVFRQVQTSGLVPKGYFNHYLQDNIDWLSGRSLTSCDAGRYSIAIDASGNVAPCLALKHSGNLLDSSLDEILDCFDKPAIEKCSKASTCNLLCSRVVGSALRHPLTAMRTPSSVAPV